jgi:mannose-1-phosphate guanylyltransferase
MLKEFEACAPEVLKACAAAGSVAPTLDQMLAIPAISIDYAVFERSRKVRVVPCDPAWSDLGNFDALYRELPPSAEGNVALGREPVAAESRGNLVIGTTRPIVLLDVEDLIVVDTEEALLVAKRGSGQRVGSLAARLKAGSA